MKRFLFFITLFLFAIQNVVAQVYLNAGDIAVVGINANIISTCSGYPSYSAYNTQDAIFLIAINDIPTNSIIDITDNAWQRKIDNRFSKNEGALRFRRTGGQINKGTIFQLNITNYISSSNQVNYENALSHSSVNNGWKVTSISNSTNTTGVNLAVNGDQLLFMSGGDWNNGTGNSHNAQYNNALGAKVIFAFNNKYEWNNYANTSNDSGLPGDETNDPSLFDIRLNHYTAKDSIIPSPNPSNKNRAFQYYNGSWTATSIKEWYMRFLNPGNWEAGTNCNSFVKNIDKSPIQILTENPEKVICINESLTLNVDNNSIVSYQWYRNTAYTSEGGTLISGATNSSYNPPTNATGTYYYYCEMKYKLKWGEIGFTSKEKESEAIASLPFKVTVNQTKTSPILNFSE